jgi:hypothetical protein
LGLTAGNGGAQTVSGNGGNGGAITLTGGNGGNGNSTGGNGGNINLVPGAVGTGGSPTAGIVAITGNLAVSGLAAHTFAIGEGTSSMVGVGPGTAGQAVFSGGSSADPAYGDFWYPEFIPAANCNNTTAGAGWSIGSGGTVTCRAGTNNLGGFITITDTSSTFAQFMTVIPFDWDSSTRPYIRVYFESDSDTTSAHTVIPQVKVSCSQAINGSTTDDQTFTAAQSLSTTTLGGSAIAHGLYAGSTVQFGSTQMSGCVAGGLFIVQIGRASDSATGNINFYGATISWPRSTPGTAQAD